MKKFLLIFVLMIALAGMAQADTLTIQNDGVTIRASATNQASSSLVMAGNVTSTDILRGVTAFPLTDPELTRAAVNSVTITFYGNGADTNSTGVRDITVHECSSFVDTEVTWYLRDISTAWTTPGGDYGPVLDTKTVNTDTWTTGNSVVFSGEALAAAVESNLGGTFYAFVKLTDDTTTNFRSLVRFDDTVTLSIDYTDISANTPSPADESVDNDTSVTFGWKPGIDPANPSVPNPAIEKHLLTYRTGDPNFLGAGTTTVEIVADADLNGQVDPDASYGPVTFGLDQVVYWKVDEIIADANDIPGHVWSFSTLPSTPQLNSELPADVAVGEGQAAELAVEATNPFTGNADGLSYQWYYSVDANSFSDVAGATTATLAIASAQVSDQGYYYCDVTVDSNGKTESSRTAYLLVKQTLAHWTMDETDFISGQYVDVVGSHNAEPNSTPTFVAGAGPDATAAGAATINPDSWAPVGTWNPLETTGQMTMSTWIKWDGTLADIIAASGRDILSKTDGWGPDVMMWSFKLRDVATNGNAGIWFYNQRDYGIRKGGVVPPNTWTHVCITYGSGVARLYIDGELSATDSSHTLSNLTTSTMEIGGASASSVFPGAMDEVMFHNYAMSAEEAAALYYQTSQEAPCLYPPEMDFNNDCETDLQDFAMFAATWADCGLVPDCLP